MNEYAAQCGTFNPNNKMGTHNKNLRIAVSFTLIALILILIAFVSPYWLVFDGKLKNPKFLNLGK